jgi:hypothetical protein
MTSVREGMADWALMIMDHDGIPFARENHFPG